MEFVRSSFCDSSACVEVSFTRSSFCDTGTCVEVADDGEWVKVRASDAPDFVVVFTLKEWKAFILGAKAGEFDLE